MIITNGDETMKPGILILLFLFWLAGFAMGVQVGHNCSKGGPVLSTEAAVYTY